MSSSLASNGCNLLELPPEILDRILNFCVETDPDLSRASLQSINNVLALVSIEGSSLVNSVQKSMQEKRTQENPRSMRVAVRTIFGYFSCMGFSSLMNYALQNGAKATTRSVNEVIRYGNLDCFRLLEEHGTQITTEILNTALSRKHLNIARYILNKGVQPNETSLKEAVRSGDVELVKHLQTSVEMKGSPISFTQGAAVSGSLEMVKYIEQFFPLERITLKGSAVSGSIAILKYCLEKGFDVKNEPSLCVTAAHYPDYVIFAIDHGALMSEELMEMIVALNNFELVKDLRDRGCPWNHVAVTNAAMRGYFDILKYLIDNGCPFTKTLPPGLSADEIEMGNKFTATTEAASNEHLDCLAYLIDHNAYCPQNFITVLISISTSHVKVIEYLRKRGFSWDETSTSAAAKFSDLETLKYLHENGCPWDKQTCIYAVMRGKIEVLKYAMDNGCPWDDTLMNAIEFSGSVDMLKLLREKGVPWTDEICGKLLQYDYLDVLKYAHENGAPWTEDTIASAIHNRSRLSVEGLIYAVEHGCPFDPASTLQAAKLYLNKIDRASVLQAAQLHLKKRDPVVQLPKTQPFNKWASIVQWLKAQLDANQAKK